MLEPQAEVLPLVLAITVCFQPLRQLVVDTAHLGMVHPRVLLVVLVEVRQTDGLGAWGLRCRGSTVETVELATSEEAVEVVRVVKVATSAPKRVARVSHLP